jgi:hypothetical protein
MKRRDALIALAAGTLTPVAMATSAPAAITAEITALLRQTEERWNAQDTAGLRDLWDRDDSEPYYLAGEEPDCFVGWDAINGYLAPKGRPVTEAIRVRFHDIRARLLSPDLAFAAYWMRTDMKLVFAPKPFGSDNRVSSVFRRKPEGWRYLCYTEAFQTPTMYMQKLMEKDVSPDYDEFYQRLKRPEQGVRPSRRSTVDGFTDRD